MSVDPSLPIITNFLLCSLSHAGRKLKLLQRPLVSKLRLPPPPLPGAVLPCSRATMVCRKETSTMMTKRAAVMKTSTTTKTASKMNIVRPKEPGAVLHSLLRRKLPRRRQVNPQPCSTLTAVDVLLPCLSTSPILLLVTQTTAPIVTLEPSRTTLTTLAMLPTRADPNWKSTPA